MKICCSDGVAGQIGFKKHRWSGGFGRVNLQTQRYIYGRINLNPWYSFFGQTVKSVMRGFRLFAVILSVPAESPERDSGGSTHTRINTYERTQRNS